MPLAGLEMELEGRVLVDPLEWQVGSAFRKGFAGVAEAGGVVDKRLPVEVELGYRAVVEVAEAGGAVDRDLSLEEA